MYLQRAAVFASRRLSVSEILCLYPLDATESEVIAVGADGKLTMSNGDQTFRYPIDGTTERNYAAAPDGISTGASEKVNTTAGIVALEMGNFTFADDLGVTSSGEINISFFGQDSSGTSVFVHVTDFPLPFMTNDPANALGYAETSTIFSSLGTYDYLFTTDSSVGFYFNADASQYGVTLNDVTRYDTSGSTPYPSDANWTEDLGYVGSYTPSQMAVIIGLGEQASTGMSGTVGATLRTDARDMQCLYPEGTKDKCGALVDNFSLIESATLTRATPATRWTSAQLLEEVAADTLRLDHDPATGAVRGYLVEAGATNGLMHSEEISNASWTQDSVIITDDATTAPDGEITADKVIPNTTDALHRVRQGVAAAAGFQKCFSFFIEAAEYHSVRILTEPGVEADFNADTGVFSNVAGADAYGAKQSKSGVWRVFFAWTLPDPEPNLQINILNNSGDRAYVGDGASGLYIWGAMFNAGVFPYSYTKTGSTAVTRDPDILADAFTKTSGTLHIEGEHIGGDGILWQADDGTENNRIRFEVSSNDIVMTVTDSGTEQAAITAGALASDGTYNIAARFAPDSFAVSLDGATAVTDTTGTVPTLTTGRFGGDTTGVTGRNWYRRTDYRDEAFTDAQLEALSA